MSIKETAKPNIGLRRIFRKVIFAFARQYLIPSRFRVYLIRLAGVRVIDAEGVFVGDNVRFDDILPESISIGRFVLLTTGCVLLTHYFDSDHSCDKSNPHHFTVGNIRIDDYVFVGAGAMLVKPVHIGEWAVIGANTVLTFDVPPGAIVVGSPARIVGYRKGFGADVL